MSIPRFLVLSILVLSQAEAQEKMDPLSVIRQTLKYWRRIYEMYYEEMALGYCWAEYFLQLGKNMETMSMYPATLSHSNFGGVEDKRPRQTKGGTLVRDTSKDWIASSQRPRKHVRRKRSSGISSATGGTSILGKRVRKSDEMRPPVQKSAKSIDRLSLARVSSYSGRQTSGVFSSCECHVPVFSFIFVKRVWRH